MSSRDAWTVGPYLAALLLLAAGVLGSCGGKEPEPTPRPTVDTTTASTPEPGFEVATFVTLRDDHEGSDPGGRAAWDAYQNGLRPVEESLGISTRLRDEITDAQGSCGPTEFDLVVVKHYPSAQALAEVIRSPEREAVREHWDPAVREFRRLVGTPLPLPASPTPSATPDEGGRHRLLLLESRDPDQVERLLAAEILLFEPETRLIARYALDPEMNEVDTTWDTFLVTFHPGRTDDPLPDSRRQALREERDRATRLRCELIGTPVGSSHPL